MLGMILKGYPRISESFISTEILLLEKLGIPMEIYSLRQPRENFSHAHVKQIQAPVTYLPEYVLPHWPVLLRSNRALYKMLGRHYVRCFFEACRRAFDRKKTATIRHFLQAGHLSALRLMGSRVRHLHAHFCHTPTSVALFASHLTGLPFSFTAHAKDIYTSQTDQLARKLLEARYCVTCTQYNARHLQSIADQLDSPPPIHVIYHGIDLEFFSFNPQRRPGPPFRILSVGRLVPKKGYEDLLQALKLLNLDGLDFQFTHLGGGELKETMQQMTKDLGLQSRVTFRGTLSHKEVLQEYLRAHCFALACKVAADGDRDGIPNVLVEAMAVGVPVVSTRVSAIPELVQDEVTGRLVEPGRPDLLRHALRETLLSSSAENGMTNRARARVEALFDNTKNVRRLYELHTDALGITTSRTRP